MTDDSTDTDARLDIDWLKTIAGALAAVSSAVLLSTLGAAGTIIGAALGSIIATVGGALYTQGLASSRRKLALAQAAARDKVGTAHAEVRRANRADDTEVQESHLEHADERLAEAHEELDDVVVETTPPGLKERLALLPWKRISLIAAGLFLIAVLVITAFELVAGRSVSSITGGSPQDSGGTTISNVGNRGAGNDDQKQPDQEPDQSPSLDESPSPSESPTESTSLSDTPELTPSESGTPTETLSPTPAVPDSS